MPFRDNVILLNKNVFHFFVLNVKEKVLKERSNETNHWKIQPISFIPQIVSFNGREKKRKKEKTGKVKTERKL